MVVVVVATVVVALVVIAGAAVSGVVGGDALIVVVLGASEVRVGCAAVVCSAETSVGSDGEDSAQADSSSVSTQIEAAVRPCITPSHIPLRAPAADVIPTQSCRGAWR